MAVGALTGAPVLQARPGAAPSAPRRSAEPPRRPHAAAMRPLPPLGGGGTGTAPASRHHVGGGERPPVPRCTPGVVVPCPQGVMALSQP